MRTGNWSSLGEGLALNQLSLISQTFMVPGKMETTFQESDKQVQRLGADNSWASRGSRLLREEGMGHDVMQGWHGGAKESGLYLKPVENQGGS